MKLLVGKNGTKPTPIEGEAARSALRAMLKGIGDMIAIPEQPYTGIVRRRALDRLRAGDAIYDKIDSTGQISRDATIMRMPPKVVGIIKPDGTYEEAGDDQAG